MYMTKAKPTKVLTMENNGVANGLPKKLETVDQSIPMAPMPKPLSPEPIC